MTDFVTMRFFYFFQNSLNISVLRKHFSYFAVLLIVLVLSILSFKQLAKKWNPKQKNTNQTHLEC